MKFFLITAVALLCTFSLNGRALAATSQPGCLSTDPNCYVLLSPLPLSNPSQPGSPDQTTNPSAYIKGIIDLAIAVAGGFAVLRLIIAGFQYITTENFSGKSNARGTMNNAIIGLLLVIASFTVLQTIGQFDSSGQSVFTDLGLTVSPIKEQSAITDQGTCLGTVAADGSCTTTVAPGGSDANAVAVGCNNNCVSTTAFSFPQKNPGIGCSGSTCFVNQTLGNQLNQVNTLLQKDGVSWQVSEMFPPKVSHASTCHQPNNIQSGTCVDAVVSDASDDATLGKFLADLNKVFPGTFEYEVGAGSGNNCGTNTPRLQHLQSKFPQYKITCEPTTTGENAHINMSGNSTF